MARATREMEAVSLMRLADGEAAALPAGDPRRPRWQDAAGLAGQAASAFDAASLCRPGDPRKMSLWGHGLRRLKAANKAFHEASVAMKSGAAA
jgi:hypothetical protein